MYSEIERLTLALCAPHGTPGCEEEAFKAAEAALSFCDEVTSDPLGGVTGILGKRDAKRRILLDAHIDQIGMVVTSITEDGFVTVGNVGGIDRRLLPAQRVHLHGRECIDGVVCAMPPHLTSGDEKVLQFEDVRIDTGYSAQELREILSPGDSVTFAGHIARMLGDRFTSPALDDR